MLTAILLSDIVRKSGIKKRLNQMKANKLIVTAQDPNDREDSACDFPVWEFESGLILVIGDYTNDWFFDCREAIEAHGFDQVITVTETEETSEWSLEALQESIQLSLDDFGSVPELALSLL